MGKKENSYAKRQRWLEDLGYANYTEYLASPEWKKIRKRFLERAEYCCEVCGKRATQVHHRSYDRGSLMGRTASLAALCGPCHKYAEFDDEGRKVQPVVANRRLAQRAAIFGRKLISSCRTKGCNNHRAEGKEFCGLCEREPERLKNRPSPEEMKQAKRERRRELKRGKRRARRRAQAEGRGPVPATLKRA